MTSLGREGKASSPPPLAGGWSAAKQRVRAALIRLVPAGVRRRLVARFPWLPLAPYSVGEAGARFDGSSWERFYAAEDPYGFETSAFDEEKYRRTLATIGPGPFTRALEVGCSVGVFTALLAPRCAELVAVDISENAVRQARVRVEAFPQVRCERRTLPAEMPPGRFDLIVCSDVLYYWPADDLRAALRVFEAALAPGGRLVAQHYRPKAEQGASLDGDIVHDLLARESVLDHTDSSTYEKYRIDRFEKPGAKAAGRSPS